MSEILLHANERVTVEHFIAGILVPELTPTTGRVTNIWERRKSMKMREQNETKPRVD
jgi:hypothetical protein